MKELVLALIANHKEIIEQTFAAMGALSAFFAAGYTVALIIPGDQPDKFMKKLLDVTERLSRKKSQPKVEVEKSE